MLRTPFDLVELPPPGLPIPDLEVIVDPGDNDFPLEAGVAEQGPGIMILPCLSSSASAAPEKKWRCSLRPSLLSGSRPATRDWNRSCQSARGYAYRQPSMPRVTTTPSDTRLGTGPEG